MSEFSMFYKLFGCMHACILHVLSVRLTMVVLPKTSPDPSQQLGNLTRWQGGKLELP